MDRSIELNRKLVDQIKSVFRAHFRCRLSPAVEQAFLRVPRHLFIPEVWDIEDNNWKRFVLNYASPQAEVLERIYVDRPLVIVVRNGEVISTSSQPSLMAYMIELLKVKRGDKVLEVGTGSGYNAGLISEIVGEENMVTVEIERDVAKLAESNLRRAGKEKVKVVCGDGAMGWQKDAPYDGVIVTVSVPDVTWWEQLRDGARIVLPLITRGVEMLVWAEKVKDKLEGEVVLPVRFLTFSGAYSIFSHYKRNIKAIARMIRKGKVDDKLSSMLGKLTPRERISFQFFVALQDESAFAFIPSEDEEDIGEGFGLWKKASPFGIAMILPRGVVCWGDEGPRRQLENYFSEWQNRKLMFSDYKVEFYQRGANVETEGFAIPRRKSITVFIPKK